MEITDLVTNIISGGAVGYITNLLAIKMLFKKYPLIGGGVILDTYEQLETSLSELVERDLINHETIESELRTEDFKIAFENFVNNFVKESLPLNIPDKKISEFDGSEKTIESLDSFLKDKKNIIDNLDFNVLLSGIKIENFFDEGQIKYFSEKVFEIVYKSTGSDLGKFLTESYSSIENKKVSEFIDKETLDIFSKNIESVADDLHIRLKDSDKEIDKIIRDILKIFDFDKLISELWEKIKNKTFLEIIGEENRDRISHELINNFIKYINSDEGHKFLDNLSNSLTELAKGIDKPILNFLNPELQTKLFFFLDRNLPYLADTAKEWLRINKNEIENLIENSIEEYYEKQELMGQFKLMIKDVIGLKVAEYFQVVEKGIGKLEQYLTENATEDITKGVINFLEEKNIGETITQLGLKPNMLSGFLKELIKQYLPKIDISIFNSFYNKKLTDIPGLLKIDLKEVFGKNIADFIVDEIKFRFFYSETFSKSIKKMISEKTVKLTDSTFSSLLSKEKFQNLTGFLPLLFTFGKGKIISKLEDLIKNQTKDKSVNEILTPDITNYIKANLTNLYLDNTSKITDTVKEINILHSYEKLTKNENISSKIHLTVDYVIQNLEPVLKGRVAKTVKNRIKKFSPEQLRDKVEDFMGKELQPITWLGAILGSISGVLLSTAGDNYFTTGAMSLVTIPAVYAIVGIGTNWQALKMLFQPYEQKRIFGIKVPFTPGIVGRRKDKFAVNMGKFVSGELINQESVTSFFNENMKKEIKDAVSENNYQKLNDLIKNNSENILNKVSPYIINELKPKISENKELILNTLISKSENFSLSEIEYKHFEKYFFSLTDKSKVLLENFINSKVNSDYSLKDLPGEIVKEINSSASLIIKDKINESIEQIKENYFKEQANGLLQEVDGLMNFEVRLKEIFSEDTKENFKGKITDYLDSIIKNKVHEGVNKYIRKSFIEEELNPHKEIKKLFNGELIPFIRKNIFNILDSLLFSFGLEKLKSEKDSISEKIVSGVRESNKDSIMYGLGDSLFNIENDIKEIVHLIIDEKLEPYLKTKKWELENILDGYIDYISMKKLEELGITEEVLNSEKITDLINKFLTDKNISDSISYLSVAMLDDILGFKLGYLLDLIGVKKLGDITEKFEEEFEITRNIFINKSNESKDKILKISDSFAAQLLDKLLYSVPLRNVFKDIPDEKISESVNNMVNLLYSSNVFENYRKTFSENIYKNLAEKKLGQIIDIKALEKQLINIFDSLVNNENVLSQIKEITTPLISDLIEKFNIIISPESKDLLLDIMINSLRTSFAKNSTELFNALNINEIVVREINEMHPREIEELFNSFAKPYFNKLILYGWMGGIIGIFAAIIGLM